jgi:hypothetical protein
LARSGVDEPAKLLPVIPSRVKWTRNGRCLVTSGPRSLAAWLPAGLADDGTRAPEAAKIAFPIAGATTVVAGSPRPTGASVPGEKLDLDLGILRGNGIVFGSIVVLPRWGIIKKAYNARMSSSNSFV